MDPEQIKQVLEGLLAPVVQQVSALATSVTALQKQTPAPTPSPAPEPAPTPSPAPAPAPAPAPVDPAINSQITEMRRALEDSQRTIKSLSDDRDAAKAAAEKAEKTSTLERALGEFAFRTPQSKATALQLLESQVKRNDAGQLVAGENLTVDTFAKDWITREHDYLLAPAPGAGAGVAPNGAVFAGGQKRADTADIKPGMSAETRTAVVAEIRNAMGQLGHIV